MILAPPGGRLAPAWRRALPVTAAVSMRLCAGARAQTRSPHRRARTWSAAGDPARSVRGDRREHTTPDPIVLVLVYKYNESRS